MKYLYEEIGINLITHEELGDEFVGLAQFAIASYLKKNYAMISEYIKEFIQYNTLKFNRLSHNKMVELYIKCDLENYLAPEPITEYRNDKISVAEFIINNREGRYFLVDKDMLFIYVENGAIHVHYNNILNEYNDNNKFVDNVILSALVNKSIHMIDPDSVKL